jgi:hypothetical protein
MNLLQKPLPDNFNYSQYSLITTVIVVFVTTSSSVWNKLKFDLYKMINISESEVNKTTYS